MLNAVKNIRDDLLYQLGFLINFGPRRLEIKRRIYDSARDKVNNSTSAPASNTALQQ